MAKGTALSVYAGAWTFWVLDFAGWATLLGGVSAMQDSCGGSAANYLLGGGSAGYHGAVECKFLFGYTWWMTWYNFLFLIISAAILGTGALSQYRPALIGLAAVGAMQSIIMANTYLYYNALPTTSGTFSARARVTTAGAIIKAISLLMMTGVMGARDEKTTVYEKTSAAGMGYRKGPFPAGPAAGTAPRTLEAETIGVRPGGIHQPTAPPATATHTTTVMPV